MPCVSCMAAGDDQSEHPRSVSRGSNLQIGFLGLDSLYLVVEYPHADLFRIWANSIGSLDDPQLRQGIPVGNVLVRRGAHGYPLSLWDGDVRLFITERVSEELRETPHEGQGMGAMLQLGSQSLRSYGEVWEPKQLMLLAKSKIKQRPMLQRETSAFEHVVSPLAKQLPVSHSWQRQ